MLFHGILFLYYTFLAASYTRPNTVRHIYYTTSIIPIVPFTMYGYNLILYGLKNIPIDSSILHLYFIEWTFTNPLFIINLSRLIPIQLSHQMILTILTVSINMLGFMSHITIDRSTKLQLYGASCSIFMGICIWFLHLYHKQSALYYHHNPYIRNKITMFKILVRIILSTWWFYPILFLLYEMDFMTHETIAVAFTCLDFIAKAIFTSILIGYYEHTYRRNSLVSYLTRHIADVVPVNTDELHTESSVSTIAPSITDNIPDTVMSYPRGMSV